MFKNGLVITVEFIISAVCILFNDAGDLRLSIRGTLHARMFVCFLIMCLGVTQNLYCLRLWSTRGLSGYALVPQHSVRLRFSLQEARS